MLVPDLIPMRRRVEWRRHRRIRAWAFVSGGYLFAIAAGGASALVGDETGYGTRVALAATQERVAAANARADALRGELAGLEATLRGVRAASGRADWSLLLRFVAGFAGESLVLDELRVQPHPEAQDAEAFVMTLRGRAVSARAASVLATELEASGAFGSVRLIETERGDGATGAVRFAVEAAIGTPAPPPADDKKDPARGGGP